MNPISGFDSYYFNVDKALKKNEKFDQINVDKVVKKSLRNLSAIGNLAEKNIKVYLLFDKNGLIDIDYSSDFVSRTRDFFKKNIYNFSADYDDDVNHIGKFFSFIKKYYKYKSLNEDQLKKVTALLEKSSKGLDQLQEIYKSFKITVNPEMIEKAKEQIKQIEKIIEKNHMDTYKVPIEIYAADQIYKLQQAGFDTAAILTALLDNERIEAEFSTLYQLESLKNFKELTELFKSKKKSLEVIGQEEKLLFLNLLISNLPEEKSIKLIEKINDAEKKSLTKGEKKITKLNILKKEADCEASLYLIGLNKEYEKLKSLIDKSQIFSNKKKAFLAFMHLFAAAGTLGLAITNPQLTLAASFSPKFASSGFNYVKQLLANSDENTKSVIKDEIQEILKVASENPMKLENLLREKEESGKKTLVSVEEFVKSLKDLKISL